MDSFFQALLVSGDTLRRQNGCDDIPAVAEPLSRTLQVAWTFLSEQFSSAGTLTLRV
ncbi:MAG: hypothetical protein ACK4RG_05335 [Fimbriimonadales bacterium]